MKELWPLEYNKYIFLFYGETLPVHGLIFKIVMTFDLHIKFGLLRAELVSSCN